MESHYCRESTSYQYLSPELNIARMHQMYSQEYTDYPGSVALYRSVFKSMKLKFHSPKKDLCGICDSFRKGTAATKDRLQNEYHAHIREKNKSERNQRPNEEKGSSGERQACSSQL